MIKINVHAGHNPSGKSASGASGFLDESNQARKVTTKVIALLKKKGYICYNCTVNNGADQQDILRKIVKKCNAHVVNLDVSIHFNSGRKDKRGDNKNGGVEVLVNKNTGIKGQAAKQICREISKLGFKNRGVKVVTNLYVLNHTHAPAILIECCFVDDKDDYTIYKKVNYTAMAKAIAAGIDKAFKYKP